MPEGLIRYRRWLKGDEEKPGYGNLADGSFFLGIHLGSQALRFATTGDPKAREQILLSLRAMKLYAEVPGKRGLLARYFYPARPNDDRWLQSPTHPVILLALGREQRPIRRLHSRAWGDAGSSVRP